MGLFTLIACNEDSYQEADKMSETRNGSVENTEPQNSVKSFDSSLAFPPYSVPGFMGTSNYQSPFQEPRTTGISYFFNNSTNLKIELTPYVGWPTASSYLDGMYANPALHASLFPSGQKYDNVMALDQFSLNPFSSVQYGPSSGTMPIGGCVQIGGVGFDYTTAPSATLYCEYGKIHLFKYRVIDDDRNEIVNEGLLKQRVGNDGFVSSLSSNWVKLTNLAAFPQLAVVLHTPPGQRELCVVNNNGTTIVPSDLSFTYSGQNYHLSFVTDLTNGYITLQ